MRDGGCAKSSRRHGLIDDSRDGMIRGAGFREGIWGREFFFFFKKSHVCAKFVFDLWRTKKRQWFIFKNSTK